MASSHGPAYMISRVTQRVQGTRARTPSRGERSPTLQAWQRYLTESLHGAGSPQAQRIQIAREMKIEDKKARARKWACISQPTK